MGNRNRSRPSRGVAASRRMDALTQAARAHFEAPLPKPADFQIE
jgi:hypothetical protein